MSSPNQDIPAQTCIESGSLPNTTSTAPRKAQGDVGASAKSTVEMNESEITPDSNNESVDTVDSGKCTEVLDSDSKMIPTTEDQPKVLNSVNMLEKDLLEVKKSPSVEAKLKGIENHWNLVLEQFGRDVECRRWTQGQEHRAHSFVQDTAAFAFSRGWVHDRQTSFIQEMMEREELEKKLNQRRHQWETKNGIISPSIHNSFRGKWSQSGQYPHFAVPSDLHEPWSLEAMFNNTDEAQGYDAQERQLRARIHEVIRQKHTWYRQWMERFEHSANRDSSKNTLIDVQPKLAINYAPWRVFKFCSRTELYDSEERQNLFAVDVLEDEPDLRHGRYSASRQVDGIEAPADVPRQGMVPERIRLNGPKAFYALIGLGPGTLHRSRSQAVLLQPYRLLLYNEQTIRDRHNTLKQKLEEFTDQEDASHVSVQHTPGSHETTRDDADQSKDKAIKNSADELQVEEDDPIRYATTSRARTQNALDYLGCLIGFMDNFVTIRQNYVQSTQCRKVHFRDLWYLFNPGDEVIRRDGKQVYKVIEVANPQHKASQNIFVDFDDKDTSRSFQISCVFVDFDGKKIGPVSTTFVVKTFAGERSINSFQVYPLRFYEHTADHERRSLSASPDPKTLRQRLIQRGKKFYQAICMKLENAFYNGPTADGDEVESQVVVDFETALASGTNFGRKVDISLKSLLIDYDKRPTTSGRSTASDHEEAVECMAACCIGEFVLDDSFVERLRREECINSLIPKAYGKLPSVAVYPRGLNDITGENTLTDDEFLLMNYRVFAFVLRTRQWAELDLTYMEDEAERNAQPGEDNRLNIDDPAFEQLVLPDGHKNIVLSLISQHYRNRDSGRRSNDRSDIVKGKGKGLILLLHGAPGVGKTSTAEGIAEKFKKPLFTITCGDLGSTAKEVEQALDLNFNLANRWGCILLLDEADVFLASRTDTDFERNGLVAVFLRVLEYYAGVLFLTTNRVGVIDEAFRSRIHISLYYPPLGHEETRAVFKLNLKLIQDRFNNEKRNIKIDQHEIIEFALDYFKANEKARWNGRQIRNACQTALALAEFKAQGESHERWDPNADVCLAVESFKTVSKAYLEFTKYLKQLYGLHEEARARELGLRAREYGRQPQAEFTQPPVFGGTTSSTQPNPLYSYAQPRNSAPANPAQTAHGQSYHPASMMGTVDVSPALGSLQPAPQVSYQVNPVQNTPTGNFMNYRASDQGPGIQGQTPQQNQAFAVPTMHFQPVQSDISQPAQPWLGQANPQSPPALNPQQYEALMQLNASPGHLGNQMAASQSFQAQQATYSQQATQNQQQQQAPQQWYPGMNVQNMQAARGQNPPGPSPPEEGP